MGHEQVTYMDRTFSGASAFNQELVWDVASVTSFTSMFDSAALDASLGS